MWASTHLVTQLPPLALLPASIEPLALSMLQVHHAPGREVLPLLQLASHQGLGLSQSAAALSARFVLTTAALHQNTGPAVRSPLPSAPELLRVYPGGSVLYRLVPVPTMGSF